MTNLFPTPSDLKYGHSKTLCPHDDVLSLFNNEAQHKSECINKAVVDWIESEASRRGWSSVEWFNDSFTGRGCWLSLTPHPIPSIGEALSRAFTRIAHHACRQGESNNRCWPDISELPEPEDWKMVGNKYSKEFAIELMTIYFSKENFLQDLVMIGHFRESGF